MSEPLILISESMIKEGIATLRGFHFGEDESRIVRAIYLAMELEREPKEIVVTDEMIQAGWRVTSDVLDYDIGSPEKFFTLVYRAMVMAGDGDRKK